MNRLTLKTEGETHVIVTRRFAASPESVYRAHTEPKVIQQWLLGPECWRSLKTDQGNAVLLTEN